MAVDIQWDMLTNSSANLGNALANAAGNVRQHREVSRNREAVTNYLANPNDQSAFQGLAARSPEMAFRLRDEQLQRARQLRADQREQLQFVGRLVRNVRDENGWREARRVAGQAGIDLSGVPENYDQSYVVQLQELDRAMNRVAPVTVAEGAQLVDPETGRVVASTPQRPRYYSIPPGGRLELDPAYQGPTTDQPEAGMPTEAPSEAPAFRPAPQGANLPYGSPLDPGPGANVQIPRVRNQADYDALAPGQEYLDPRGRRRRKAG